MAYCTNRRLSRVNRDLLAVADTRATTCKAHNRHAHRRHSGSQAGLKYSNPAYVSMCGTHTAYPTETVNNDKHIHAFTTPLNNTILEIIGPCTHLLNEQQRLYTQVSYWHPTVCCQGHARNRQG